MTRIGQIKEDFGLPAAIVISNVRMAVSKGIGLCGVVDNL